MICVIEKVFDAAGMILVNLQTMQMFAELQPYY